MQGLAARLYRSDLAEIADYLHHFLDEENKHSVYFGGFCPRYARITAAARSPSHADGADVDDFLFFARSPSSRRSSTTTTWSRPATPGCTRWRVSSTTTITSRRPGTWSSAGAS